MSSLLSSLPAWRAESWSEEFGGAMHGEYKTPGGKLVIADFDVRNGSLAGVEVSGDFFLEPPEALADITAALEDAPADLAEEEFADRISAALGPEVEMVGFSAEAVARAVKRAIS
jgi:lipoate-protein ligase A